MPLKLFYASLLKKALTSSPPSTTIASTETAAVLTPTPLRTVAEEGPEREIAANTSRLSSPVNHPVPSPHARSGPSGDRDGKGWCEVGSLEE